VEEAVITIVNPPNPPNAVSNKDTMGGFGQLYASNAKHSMPPLDILYTTALLRSKSIPVMIIDCLSLDWELGGLIFHLQSQKSKLVAIRTSTPTFNWDLRVAAIIKITLNAKIIMFGPHVSIFPMQTIQQPFIDAIVLGEPEMAFLSIVELGFKDSKGVWYKEGDNIIQNNASSPIDDLNELPFPAWDMISYKSFNGGGLMRNLKPFVTALTSRGCPHGCTYCPYPVIQGRKLRVRSPENVVDELHWLVNSMGVKAVLFRDPEFALQRDRVMGICEAILKRDIRLAWRCETRMEDLDEKLVSIMAKAGCIGINTGVESADPHVLRNLKRKLVPFDQAKKVVKACNKNGVDSFCFFIIGLPGDTRQSVLKTIDYAVKLKPTFVQFTVATPYPGTELRNWAWEKGFIENETLSGITGYDAAMRNDCLAAEEIRTLQKLANEAWEMRWHKVVIRILGNVYRSTSEVSRYFRFRMDIGRLS
jgi:radical SAM superfamily enzyme YgiQ (UPF0313 family)